MKGSRTPRRDVTVERLRELLDYNEKTGKFYAGSGRNFGKEVGGFHGKGYLKIALDGVTYLAHRLAWLYVTGDWPFDVIDHINGDKKDNRIANLRAVTASENIRAYHALRALREGATA